MRVLLPALLLSLSACNAQKTSNMKENNPLICDIETGMCAAPGDSTQTKVDLPANEKPIKVIYFTDPICSSCWGIEPQLRKLKLEYGSSIEVQYHMGGLLPDWSYNSGGISGPKDVATHWDEASVHYDMPIDGDVWLEDPLNSSYPPSIYFKAAQMQDNDKAIVFMRHLREQLFLQKKNITKWEVVKTSAEYSKLNLEQLQKDFDNGTAKKLFEDDLALARKMGVRGFPTIFVVDANNNYEFIYGSRPYPVYEGSVLKLFPTAEKNNYDTEWKSLFEKYPTLTAKEFSVLNGMERKKSEAFLDDLVKNNSLNIIKTKNGNMYLKK